MLALRIALRYLFSKKSHNAVNVISIVSTIGVAVATAAIVCVLSVFNGFTDLSLSRLSIVDPDVKVEPVSGKVIKNADSLATVVAMLPEVATVDARIEDQALAMYHSRQRPITLIGVPLASDSTLSLRPPLLDGEYGTNRREIVVSVGVALNLGARPGYYDAFALYAPRRKGRINPANPMAAFVSDSLIVGGVYEVADVAFDASTAIVPIDVARKLFDYTTEASSLAVTLADGVDEADGAAKVASAVGDAYTAKTRLMQQENSFRMIEVEKWISFAMLAFILLIASFNVVSTLSMLIIEKRENIATLFAMGATRSMVDRIFMFEGWMVSLLGGICGLVLGVVLVLAQQYGEIIKLNGNPAELSITAYPVRLDMADLAVVAILTVVLGYVIGAFTSRMMSERR